MTSIFAKSSVAVAALFGVLIAAESAAAAELVKMQGKVTVNRGDGFEAASQGMVLKAGDQVLVGEKSSASLVYSDPGCVFEVAPASVITVSEVGPCIPGQSAALGESVFVTPAATSGDPDLTPLYVMGGLAVVGTAAFFATEGTNKDSNNRPGGDFSPGPGSPGPSPP